MAFLQTLIDQWPKNQPHYVCVHLRPDGDAIGAQVAFTRYLKSLGLNAFCTSTSDIPDNFKYLLQDTPQLNLDTLSKNGVFIALDCADKERLPPELKNFPFFLNIDHHPGNLKFARYNWVQDEMASTCDILVSLLKEVDWSFDAVSAQALYAGIVTDTGNFSHSNVTADTFFHVAYLLQQTQIKPYKIIQALFDRKTFSQIQLLSHFLSKIQLFYNDRIACVEFSQKDYEPTQTQHKDTEGFIYHLMTIQSVQIAAFVEHTGEFTRCSLRSKNPNIIVKQVAQQWGGGGHPCAAAFQTPSENFNLETLINDLLKVLY